MATTNAIVDIRAQLRAELEAQKDRVTPPTGGRISTAGKVFTLPDGRTSTKPLNLIILDWRITHAYYTGVYDPAKRAAPVCFAMSKTLDCAPDASKIESPKNKDCASCPFNEYGSGSNNKGKACKETRRLAVIPVDATIETVPFILDVSPTGIKGFDAYISQLKQRDKHAMEAITEIAFRSDATYPTLTFGLESLADDEQIAIAYKLREVAAQKLDYDPT